MDKNSTIGYVLIFVIFAAWFMYSSNQQELQRIEQEQQDSIANAQRVRDSISFARETKIQATEPVVSDSTTTIANNDSTDQPVQVVEAPEELFTLENEELNLQLTSKGGFVNKATLKNYRRSDSSDLVLIEPGKCDFSYTIPLNSGFVETIDLDFTVKSQSDSGIVLEHKFPQGGSIEQEYSLSNGFLVDYRVRLMDLQSRISRRHSSIETKWDMELPLQEKALENERNVSTVYYKYKSDKGVDNLSERSDEDDDELQGGVHWLSFKQQFFMSTLIFPQGLEESGTAIEVEKPENADYVAEMAAEFDLPFSGDNYDENAMQFYFGPNHYQTLKKMDVGLERTIELGPKVFSWVNKLFVIPIFNWLSKFISSYGVIILLLTLMIKLILILPMYKSYLSSAKMRILKPELEAIKEKADGDMAKMQQEQMKLYKRVGVSPFGGCLPQLVQLPILIALFRFFPSSIELRQKSFLWADDLSTYDAFINFGTSIWPFGDHISLFTLLMAASSLLYTIYNQQSTAGVSNQMKYIMYLMPVMLFFWFNSYAAGLSYYYFLANMITFGQNFVFSKWIVDEDKIRKEMEANKKKKVSVKKSRFQKRLEEMAKKRGVDPKQLRR
ncbi:MAG: membrane protein insertase YidC [Bacteroidia bacterium]|nr:membrane protein insertase YidC [Bacteroidia bacterium]